AALALDPWQSGMAEQSARAEIATVLCIPEGTATTLVRHATELVASHPATRDALTAGKLSWRHIGTVLDETGTLAQTPGMSQADLADFEQHLLRLAPGSTATSFKSKARRLREGTHPESLPTRTKQAILGRAMTLEPGRDGMSWLTLHLPAPAAEGIWVHCTRQARTHQSPEEHRTLTQLRIDIATALLLGHHGINQPRTSQSPTGQHGHTAPPDNGLAGSSDAGASAGTGAGAASAVMAPSRLGGTGARATKQDATGERGQARSAGAASTDPVSAVGDGVVFFDPAPWDLSTKGSFTVDPDSPLFAGIRMATPGYADGVVDGVPEDPLQDYLDMLAATRNGQVITDPPLPEAQILVTVPLLGALGITNEPAELIGYGPIPETIARKLLANSTTFLRLFTDPITNEPLDMNPDRYWVRDSERAVLRAMAQCCYFPQCTNPVLDTELDHVQAWEHGGKSTHTNLRPACARHHALKHLKDDKDKHGHYRAEQDPDRAGIRLRGWTPSTTPDGRISWTSPSGRDHPEQPNELRPPAYPKWLKKTITKALQHTASAPGTPPSILEYFLTGKHIKYHHPNHG
uniref:HNH endonuclease signature motif containing protein n=1 Tax=Arthrobacter sp. GMC3 TaxID=2058894 RepID=UPI000CE3E198